MVKVLDLSGLVDPPEPQFPVTNLPGKWTISSFEKRKADYG